jgi:hypothetical protein
MIIERKEYNSKSEFQSYLNNQQSKTYAVYEIQPGQRVQEIVDHELKKGPIKGVVILR